MEEFMKKILLSTIAIVGITTGVSLASQNAAQHVTVQSSEHQPHHAASSEVGSDIPASHVQMQHSKANMQGHENMGDMAKMKSHGMMEHGMMDGKKGMMKRHGKMHNMSGKMNHGKKGSHGKMNGNGLMGIGFSMPGQEKWTSEQTELFLNNTSEIRKELVVKRYEISEAKRNKNTTPDQIGKLDKELIDIRTELQNKALGINVPTATE